MYSSVLMPREVPVHDGHTVTQRQEGTGGSSCQDDVICAPLFGGNAAATEKHASTGRGEEALPGMQPHPWAQGILLPSPSWYSPRDALDSEALARDASSHTGCSSPCPQPAPSLGGAWRQNDLAAWKAATRKNRRILVGFPSEEKLHRPRRKVHFCPEPKLLGELDASRYFTFVLGWTLREPYSYFFFPLLY